MVNILEKIETFKDFNLLKHLEENNFSQIIKDINEFSSIKGISENLNDGKAGGQPGGIVGGGGAIGGDLIGESRTPGSGAGQGRGDFG